jgi:protein O-GlcNAc transferase
MTARANLASALQYEGRLDEAIREFQALIRQAPHLAKLHYNLGNAFWGHKELANAIAEYHKALELEPGHIEALVNLGCAQCDAGEIDQGLATLRDATRRRPEHKKAWANLAKALAGVGDLKGLQELARSKPECKEGHGYLGKVLLDRGQHEEAIKPLRKAIELDPNDSWIASRRIWLSGPDRSSTAPRTPRRPSGKHSSSGKVTLLLPVSGMRAT